MPSFRLTLNAGFVVMAALTCGVVAEQARAQSAVHAPGVVQKYAADFSGIWMTADEDAKFKRKLDLPYRPDWAERYRQIRERAARGEHIRDNTSKCLPPGMPHFFFFLYPIEILMTPGQVTILAEYFNETRRIFTDGRKHPPVDELEATFRGHSIGHWEGKTLVVDTIGVRGDTVFSALGAPHSEQMHITERIRALGPDSLDWEATIDDPVAFEHPLVMDAKLKRAPAQDEIREYVCEESANQEVYAPPKP